MEVLQTLTHYGMRLAMYKKGDNAFKDQGKRTNQDKKRRLPRRIGTLTNLGVYGLRLAMTGKKATDPFEDVDKITRLPQG
jgi:hypothetical protein